MRLIRELDSKITISKTGKSRKRKQGLFLCPKCEQQVSKELSNGLKIDTCGAKGCQKNRSFRHGHVNTGIYIAWANMKARCDNPKSSSYNNYGGKGITYPIEWKTFKGFFNDMGFSYKEGLSIDRIDSSKPYSKENCQWIELKENRVKERRKLIAKYTLDDQFIVAYKSAKEAADVEGIPYPAYITKVARGERKQYKGFKWQFININ